MITQLRERKSEIHQLNQETNDDDGEVDKKANGAGDDGVQYKRIKTSQADPFMLLKEVVQMSKYMNPTDINTSSKADDFQMKCEMNISNYKAMVQNNYEKLVTETTDEQTKTLASKYNPAALQEKMKAFKFAKSGADPSDQKDANWFSKLQSNAFNNRSSSPPKRRAGGMYKFEMSKEEHKKFN